MSDAPARTPTPMVDQRSPELDAWTNEALADPRVGDEFHEQHSYRCEVTRIEDDKVYWRDSTGERGVEQREHWASRFRYGGTSSVATAHWAVLLRRGPA